MAEVVGIEGGTVVIERPQATCQLVRQRDCGLVVPLALLQFECPGLQGIERLAGASSQAGRAEHGAAAVDEQGAQVPFTSAQLGRSLMLSSDSLSAW